MGRETFLVEEFPWPLAAGFADALEVSLNGSTADFVEWSWNCGLALCGTSQRRHSHDCMSYEETEESERFLMIKRKRQMVSSGREVIRHEILQYVSGRAS